MTIPKKLAKVTEAQVCRYLGKNLAVLKEEAKALMAQEIDNFTSTELFDRFWQGRQQYGGEFDVEAIPCTLERKQEALDYLLYHLISKFQREH